MDSELNNTYIYDELSDCDPSIIFNERICQIRRGDYFLETDSSSFVKASDIVSAGGASQEITTTGTEIGVKKLLSTSLAGTDSLTVASSDSLTLPIGIPRLRWDNGYTTLHALGLGSDSTFLNGLVKAGQIPSRVWSIFWGRMWTDVGAMDGQVVLGGYDQDKVIGRNFTQPLDYSEETGCWTGMKVTVSNLLVNFRNGTDFSIMPRNSAVQTCIVPHRQLLLEAPGSIVDAFESATRMKNIGPSFGLHWSARLFNSTIFDGDVTFILSNGLQVRIPNSQFLTPFVDVARNGSRVIDKSRTELLMNGVGNQPATLGRYFLTAAYLMVDHDARSFTLWQANPSTSSTLVPVSGQASGDCTGDGGSGAGNDNGPESGSGSSGNSSSSTVSTGAIAGGVVGGVAVLAAIVAVFFFLRRRRRSQDIQSPEPGMTEPMDPSAQSTHNHGPQEVHGNGIYPTMAKPADVQTDQPPKPPYYEIEGSGNWNNNNGAQHSTYELDGGRA